MGNFLCGAVFGGGVIGVIFCFVSATFGHGAYGGFAAGLGLGLGVGLAVRLLGVRRRRRLLDYGEATEF